MENLAADLLLWSPMKELDDLDEWALRAAAVQGVAARACAGADLQGPGWRASHGRTVEFPEMISLVHRR